MTNDGTRYEHVRDDDPEYDIPLQERRPFGSGLKRKRIEFVPASTGVFKSTEEVTPAKQSKSISDLYLSMVLPKNTNSSTSTPPSEPASSQLCQVCDLPLDSAPGEAGERRSGSARPHEASIAHQVCMSHSHPPSALDRSRMGFGVLQSQGWNPDSRQGLGATQQGIQFPIKVKPKDDKLGIGVKVPKDFVPQKKEKVQKMDAKKIRKMAAEDKKRSEKLRQQFYGSSDIDKYLGGG